jgi:hypothetical protein
MDQASCIFARWDGAAELISREGIACGSWKKAVGKKIWTHARAVRLMGSTLVVEVDDEIWQKNLRILRKQVLSNLERSVGPGMVDDLHCVVMPPRIPPGRAGGQDQRLVLSSPDEADQIADPGLRRIYKAARRRETA